MDSTPRLLSRLTRVLLAFGAPFATACAAAILSKRAPMAEDSPPQVRGLLQSDRDSYMLMRSPESLITTIVATFTNRTRDTLLVENCSTGDPPPFSLERWTNREWRAAYTPVCAGLKRLDPRGLFPGEHRTDTLSIRAWLREDTHPRWVTDSVPGWYRIHYWNARRGPHGRDSLPKPWRVSNAFRIGLSGS